MKSGAEPRASLAVRGGALFDRVDYRLIETPEDKDQLYLMRYRAYTRGGLIPTSGVRALQRRYDDAPNAWTFGIYVDGELYSSIRLHVLTSEQRMSCTTDLFGDVLHPRLDRGEVFIDPARFVADPEKAQRFPELPYLTVRLAYLACEYFNADTGLALVRPDASGVLSPGLPERDHRRTAPVSERIGKGGIDGVRFPGRAGTGHDPVSHHALQCLRAADAVPA